MGVNGNHALGQPLELIRNLAHAIRVDVEKDRCESEAIAAMLATIERAANDAVAHLEQASADGPAQGHCAAPARLAELSPRPTTSGPLLDLDHLGPCPLQAAERELIRQAMERTGGNKKRAAELLGISRFALQRKIEKLLSEH